MISPSIQNEIVETIGDVIKNKIVNRVKASKYFSILCDETSDTSTIEQMTICIRYIDTSTFTIREDFLGFVEMASTTGTAIKDVIKTEIEKIGLSFDFLRGQGYDGGSNMSGKNNGVQALILQEQPLAFYTHCFSHSLNLCLSKACEVVSIKNMTTIVGTVSTFFSCSAKRTDTLKYFIDTGLSDEGSTTNKKTKLKKLCETRWVDRHDSLITFKELYIYTVTTLEYLEYHDSNPETSSKASLYVSAITKSDFLVALEVAVTCFAYTLQLSQVLQSKQQDLSKALSNVTVVRQALEANRKNAHQSFKEIMNSVTKLALKVGAEITMPRTCGRQTKRVNVNAKDPEEYYKISIFIPFLDNLINQLHFRFDKRLQQIMPLEGLIPTNFGHYDDESILAAASIYENDFPVSMMSCLKAEIFIWKKQWELETNLPESAVEALQHTELLPNIKKLLQFFATLPVTSATPERKFSVLKRLKIYLRTTMTEERLNGLALASINKDDLDFEDIEKYILPAFIKRSPRRIQTLDWTKYKYY